MNPLNPKVRANVIPPARKCPTTGKPLCRWCGGKVPKGRRAWCSDTCVDDALIRCQPGYARRKVEERDKGVCAGCGRDTGELKSTLRRLGVLARDGVIGYSRTLTKAAKRYRMTENRLHTVATCSRTSVEADEWNRRNEEREAQGLRRLAFAPDRVIDVTPAEQRIRLLHRRLMKLAAARMTRLSMELTREGFDGIGRFGVLTRSLWDADHILPVVKGGGGCGLENYRTLCQPCHKAATKKLAADRALERRPETNQPEFNL